MNYYLPKETQELSAEILKNFIEKHKNAITHFETLRNYYDNSETITRKFREKIITRTGYAKYITRINTGFLLGSPVEYQAEENINLLPLLDSYKKQVISNLDKKLAKDCSIFGRAFEMIYSNEDSEPKSAKINVRNAFLIRDDSVEHKKLFGVVYEPVFNKKGEENKGEYRVSILSNAEIRKYKLKSGSLESIGEPEKHYFGEVPLIEYLNDEDGSGDFEGVLTDIDAYNVLKSDRLNDRRKLADAILAVTGARLKKEDKDDLMDTMVALLPDGAKMEYISKNTDETGTDILRRNINDDIHKISMTPDMTDQNFIGNSSGVSLAYKILPFMMNSIDKRREFEVGLMERFRIYNHFLKVKKKMSIVSTDQVDIIFKQVLPKNDLETSQIINNLLGSGLVDKSTLAAQLSFVQNAEEIVALAKKEQTEIDLKVGNGFGGEE